MQLRLHLCSGHGNLATVLLRFCLANSLVLRAKAMTAPEPWVTPPEVREKIHLLYQKSEFIEKSMKHFSGRWA